MPSSIGPTSASEKLRVFRTSVTAPDKAHENARAAGSPQHASNKITRALRFRRCQHLNRITVLDDAASVEKDEPASDFSREVQFVAREER